MGIIRHKADDGGQINIRAGDGEWISIHADRIEATGTRIVEDEDADAVSLPMQLSGIDDEILVH